MPAASREWMLRVTGPSESYDVWFSHDLLPAWVKYRSGAKPDAASEIEYSDYAPLEIAAAAALSYPRRISFKLPGPGASRADLLVDAVVPVAAP